MKFLLMVSTAAIAGYLGYKAGRAIINRNDLHDPNYEYHGDYNVSSTDNVSTINSVNDLLEAFSKVIYTWLELNDCHTQNHKEILIGRDNVIAVEFDNSTDMHVSLFYRNLRYANWRINKTNFKIKFYDKGANKMSMMTLYELLDWFAKEGVCAWRVKKIPV